MPESAEVRSIEALESFRAHLIVYISKARPTLEEIDAEVVRTRQWLEEDRRVYWENQVRRRSQQLEAARSELFSAGISVLRTRTAAQTMMVRRAELALEEAENKLRTVKKWIRDFDTRVVTLARQMERLQGVVITDMPKAVDYLGQACKTLADYANITPALAADLAAPAQPESTPAQAGPSAQPEEPKP